MFEMNPLQQEEVVKIFSEILTDYMNVIRTSIPLYRIETERMPFPLYYSVNSMKHQLIPQTIYLISMHLQSHTDIVTWWTENSDKIKGIQNKCEVYFPSEIRRIRNTLSQLKIIADPLDELFCLIAVWEDHSRFLLVPFIPKRQRHPDIVTLKVMEDYWPIPF